MGPLEYPSVSISQPRWWPVKSYSSKLPCSPEQMAMAKPSVWAKLYDFAGYLHSVGAQRLAEVDEVGQDYRSVGIAVG